MTDAPAIESDADRHRTEREIAEQLRLRPTLPPVMRLSRKVLIGLGAAASIGIGGVLIVALQGQQKPTEQPQLVGTERVAQAEGLGKLPRDYSSLPQTTSDVPKLGPPLPGDLGRPMLSAQERGQPMTPPPNGAAGPSPALPPANPAVERAQQARETARTSALFSTTQAGASSAPPAPAAPAPIPPTAVSSTEPPQASLSRAEAFLARDVERSTTSSEGLQTPPSPYVVQAGSIISAALITGLRSDLPGQVTAQVTSPVYDSPTGAHLLVPQGARLIGQYDAEVASGQQRALLVWTRLIYPDGRSIVLERLPAADAQGHAGLQDRVDHHWGGMLRAGVLSTLLGVGAELGSSGDGELVRAIRQGAQRTFNQAGQQVVQRELNIKPTLTIRSGMPVRVIVTRDLVLEPWGSGR